MAEIDNIESLEDAMNLDNLLTKEVQVQNKKTSFYSHIILWGLPVLTSPFFCSSDFSF